MQAALTEMEDRAARLPDGTRVFRDENGIVRRADGTIVEDDLAATILWTENEPSFEDYSASQDGLASLEAQRDEVTAYQNDILGPARDHLTDPDNPPSLEELDGILKNIETEMPKAVKQQMNEAPSVAAGSDVTTNVALPSLSTPRT